MDQGIEKISTSKVIFMCGPAGSGKSTLAKKFENSGMIVLSYDKESFKRGLNKHPLPEEIITEIKTYLDDKLIALIQQNRDIVLDYSFWSRNMRNEYITLLEKYHIKPLIYYINTPKKVVMERIRQRKGSHHNDIMLSEETASLYYDQFQPPSLDEGEIIIVEGY